MGDRQRVATLHERLRDQSTRLVAMEVLRQLVNQVILAPENGELAIVLRSDLAAMLSFAAGKKKPGIDLRAGHSGDSGSLGSSVAETRSRRLLPLIEQRIPRIAA